MRRTLFDEYYISDGVKEELRLAKDGGLVYQLKSEDLVLKCTSLMLHGLLRICEVATNVDPEKTLRDMTEWRDADGQQMTMRINTWNEIM